jgi:hypothetical protein
VRLQPFALTLSSAESDCYACSRIVSGRKCAESDPQDKTTPAELRHLQPHRLCLLPCWDSVGTIAIGGVPLRSANSHIAAEHPPGRQGAGASCGRTELNSATQIAAYRSFYRSSAHGAVLKAGRQASSPASDRVELPHGVAGLDGTEPVDVELVGSVPIFVVKSPRRVLPTQAEQIPVQQERRKG